MRLIVLVVYAMTLCAYVTGHFLQDPLFAAGVGVLLPAFFAALTMIADEDRGVK